MPRRIAVIDYELCKPDKCGFVCRKVCPIVRMGEECIVMNEELGKPVIDENLCIGCGICVKKCPFKAITIVNLPEALDEDPVHRYGQNGFALFRLPFPVKGEVVGIIGPNGVGKTTALLILTGKIKPNLGKDHEAKFEDLIKIFRGTEIQNYLEMLKNGNIKVALKPQRVDLLPKYVEGLVGDLLKKVDERGVMKELVKHLELEKLLEKEISKLSGGELQRVAIAATLGKEADFYYFDEPTSFLDVRQRLNAAKVIRKFTSGKACMVVDHDLATLDLMADRVHIIYGTPGAFGVVSKPYGVRNGINTYLDGYIKEDNVRIRKLPIRFESVILPEVEEKEPLVEFKEIKKKLGNFTLVAKEGVIHRKEVLGVIGSNGLGKTTLARILAGELKPDEGTLTANVSIAYKPQYPQIEFEGTVEEYLSSEAEIYGSQDFKNFVIKPLELEKLLEKEISKLSGGELQRVAIAATLGKEAELYILDEPSAYLDVEQRLALPSMLRRLVENKEASVFVIDHDLLFISQVSAKSILFLGEPGVKGSCTQPLATREALNLFLKEVDVTFRKDPQTGRPRANKPGSVLDREQKEKGIFWAI